MSVLTATVSDSEGSAVTGTVDLTVQTQTAWRGNEPPGLTPMADNPHDILEPPGWNFFESPGGHPNSTVNIVTDANAPQPAPKNVAQFFYAVDHEGGFAAGELQYFFPASRELYLAMYLKISEPWEQHPTDDQKLWVLFHQTQGNFIAGLARKNKYGEYAGVPANAFYDPTPAERHIFGMADRNPTVPRASLQFLDRGSWHLLEAHLLYPTVPGSSADGIVRWWVNREIQGDHTGLDHLRATGGTPDDAGFFEYKLTPTWGGGTGVFLSHDQSLWVDQTYLSVR